MSASEEPRFQPPPPPQIPESKPLGPRPIKLRPFGLGFFILGLIIAGAGIPGIIPGGFGTGGLMALFGAALFAFSFIRQPVIPEGEAPLSFFDKATGIFYEPSRVFRNLRFHPNWIGAFVTVSVLTVIYSFAFVQRITPERIVEHMTRKVSEMGPPFTPRPEAVEKMRNDQMSALKQPIQRAGAVVRSFAGLFLLASFVAGLCLLATLAFGGRINFWQALAVVFYAWLPVTVIQKVLGLVILYLKAPDDLHPVLNQETTLQDNLGVLLSPADHPILFVLASFIGLTVLYGVWLRAKGLNLGATKVGSGAAWGVSITLYILLVLFVTIWTALFPGFIS
jgi:Yip1 domain